MVLDEERNLTRRTERCTRSPKQRARYPQKQPQDAIVVLAMGPFSGVQSRIGNSTLETRIFYHLPGGGFVDPNVFLYPPVQHTTAFYRCLPSPGISPHMERSAGREEVKVPAKVVILARELTGVAYGDGRYPTSTVQHRSHGT